LILPLETEIKIRISSVAAVRKRLRDLGYRVHARRVFESNVLFDTPDRRLGKKSHLLRIRRVGRVTLVTYKGPSQDGPHKSREEIQTTVADANAMEEIFARLGMRPSFRYEKYRTEYSRQGSQGIITVDETPIGNYLEIEGAPRWIDTTAKELGYSRSEYITKSYGALYREYCSEHGVEPSDMVFESRRTPDR
jgi:adenylate cyclase class 2